MSSSQSQQQKKNRKAFSKTLKSEIKRKPHTQPINGVQYTYGLLEKKSESSLFNNERFLIIKGHSTFGYVSKLPDQTLLPFLEQTNIPKSKVQIPLEKLQFKNQKQILIVEFFEQGKKDKTRWEFTCGSKVKAIQWRQKLQGAKNQKISLSKNTAFKVILEDAKQHNEESQNQKLNTNQKNPIYQNENPPILRAQDQLNKKTIELEDEDKKILKQTDFNPFTQQTDKDLSQNNPFQPVQNNIDVSHEKFPEVNIFESLLYSSPNKQPSRLFFDTQQKTNQKQFSELKNQQNTQQKNSQLQYQRLKRQQQALQQQLHQQQSRPYLTPSTILSPFMDKAYQLQKLRKQWSFEFAKGGNEYEIVERFRIYCEIVVTKIIDELSLEEKRRYYQPVSESTTSLGYEIDGVSFRVCLRALREVVSYEKRGAIISSYESKLAQKEFRNYDYILSLTANKGRIRVPLSMVVEYKGFICVVKAVIPEGEGYENLESLSKELALLEAESKVSNSVFESGEAGRIVPLNAKAYEKIARLQNSLSSSTTRINKRFDICYLQSLTSYLPQDFYYFTKLDSSTSRSQHSISPLSPVHTLRKQLIQDEQYDEVIFSGENMANVAQRLKIHPQMKQAIDVLVTVSKSISDRVSAVVRALESLQEIVTNSKELAKLMHGYGVNMRYLGLVFERSRESWLRSIIISEIVARCFKKLFNFSLQECITNLQQTKPQNTQKYQIKLLISFLNKLLGCSQQTQQFWLQLSRQSQQDFRCLIDRRQINIGYLLTSLESQCGIELTGVLDKREQYLKSTQPLTVQNFGCFVVKSKTYNLSFTQLYTTVDQHLKQPTQQSFQQLSILLNLQRRSELPSHFMMGEFYSRIILYMINWISPKDGRQFYYPQREGRMMPSRMLYEMKLSEIKWVLKEELQSQAERIRDWMVEHIHMWLGEYHPLLSQLYNIFSRYYLSSKRQQKKAITYCKSSIKNFQKLLSRDNIKLADSYYMLAEVYINYDKKSQALGSLLRAREIMDKREGGNGGEEEEESEGYGMVVLRIGQVMLALQMVEQAINEGRKAYQSLVQSMQMEKLVECIELLGRCYQLASMFDEYAEFVEIFITNHHDKLQLISQNSHLLQRIMKVILLPYLRALTAVPQITGQLGNIIQAFPSLSSITQSTSANSVGYLKQLIGGSNNNNIRFPLSFISILQDELEGLVDEVDASGLMARWKGFQAYVNNKNFTQKLNSLNNINPKLFQFLSQLQTLAIILGQSWFIGALNYF